MARSICFLCIHISILAAQTAAAKVEIGDIRKAIDRQDNLIKSATEKTIKAKRDEEERRERETKKREQELQEKVKAAEREREEQERKLNELQSIAEIRTEAQQLSDTAKALTISLDKERAALQAAQAELNSKTKNFENEFEVLKLKQEKFRLENEAAENSAWKWWCGFSVALFSAVVAALAAIIDFFLKRAQIKQIQDELKTMKSVGAAL